MTGRLIKMIRYFPHYLLLFNLAIIPVIRGEDPRPVFLEPVNNATVVIGRDATLTCVVDNIGPNKVAWIHLDRQMIVAIHQHLVTRIPRYSASHDSHRNTWTLHLRGAQPEDAGRYMCQVNCSPMITQIGIIDVVVPPSIVDAESSASHITTREGSRVTLTCKGYGVPMPKVTWRREDGRAINIGDRKKEVPVASVEGEILTLNKVSRQESGAYLCIASNGVPPSVSKRILLDVEFPPMVWVPVQLVGSPLGGWVSFDCHAEAQPKAITYWVRTGAGGQTSDSDLVLLPSRKIQTESSTSGYRTHMKLTIQQLEAQDLGSYRCVAKNSMGEAEGVVKLIETALQTTPTLTTPTNTGKNKKTDYPTKYSTENFFMRSWTTPTTLAPQPQSRNRFQTSNSTGSIVGNSQSITSNTGPPSSSAWTCVVTLFPLLLASRIMKT